MLTKEENELLTRVGPGTPCGELLREQIAVVQAGGDPLGVIRDPDKNRFIELPAWLAEEEDEVIAAPAGGTPNGRSMAAVFDERHEAFQVPPGAARPVDR